MLGYVKHQCLRYLSRHGGKFALRTSAWKKMRLRKAQMSCITSCQPMLTSPHGGSTILTGCLPQGSSRQAAEEGKQHILLAVYQLLSGGDVEIAQGQHQQQTKGGWSGQDLGQWGLVQGCQDREEHSAEDMVVLRHFVWWMP